MLQRSTAIKALGLGAALSFSSLAFQATANAAIFRVSEEEFDADALPGVITFSEFPLGTTNPIYQPSDYGAAPSFPTVSFGGVFDGQTVGTGPIPPGAQPSGVVNGMPIGPLSLDLTSPQTFITTDSANPTSPVLSGTPRFDGPISILFDMDLAGISVGNDAGFFDAIGGTKITAFARDGSVLGSFLNEETGIEFFGLMTDKGQNEIAGLQFSFVDSEPAGFAIDNLRFARSETVPEPASVIGILALGSLGAGSAFKRKQQPKN